MSRELGMRNEELGMGARRLEPQTRLGRQLEQSLARRLPVNPAAGVPHFRAEIVAAVEDLPHCDAAEPADGEERRGFHLHRQAALGPSPGHPRGRLAIEAVGRPGLAGDVGDAVAFERGLDGGHRFRRRGDLARGRQIVVGRALVAHGRIGHDDMAEHQVAMQHPRAAAGDELPAAEGDEFIGEPGGQRRADAGMRERHRAAVHVHLVHWVRPHLGAEGVDQAQRPLVAQPADDVLEKAQDAMGRDVDGGQHARRLDDGVRAWVVFQYGVVSVEHG